MNPLKQFSDLPPKTKRTMSLGLIIGLTIALPLFVWSLINLNFNQNKKAASGEPSVCVPINKEITVTPDGGSGTCHDIQTAINSVNGDGFKINVSPGQYYVFESIVINSKTNINITGDPQFGNQGTVINFSQNGYGFLIQNSTGTITWLSLMGGSANGMLSIQNTNHFSVGYLDLYSQNSHTVDIQNSGYISIYNSSIRSSAGALEINGSNNIAVNNNRIYNSDNAISVYNSAYIHIGTNLVHGNRESGLYTSNVQNMQVVQNTFVNNSYDVPSNGNVHLSTAQGVGTSYEFFRNIISSGAGAGIQITGSQPISLFEHNDVFGNNPNYQGYTNQTGTNSNISLDPLLDTNSFMYCPLSNSPVIYGNVANYEYMGAVPPCAGGSTSTTSPTASPTVSPVVTSSPSASPTATTTAPPTQKAGDVNNDGIVNIVDLGIIIDYYGQSNPSYANADLNKDGTVNIVDIGIVIDNY